MVSHEYPPNGFDQAVLKAFRRASMLPSFTSPSQAIDRLARLEEARDASMGMNGTGSVRDERDERLERAGYLLVVGIDRLVRAIAAFGWRMHDCVQGLRPVLKRTSSLTGVRHAERP
jgi:hypothetical protein